MTLSGFQTVVDTFTAYRNLSRLIQGAFAPPRPVRIMLKFAFIFRNGIFLNRKKNA